MLEGKGETCNLLGLSISDSGCRVQRMNVIESCGAFSITIIMDAIKSGLLFSNWFHFQLKWTTISYLLTRWYISWMWRKGVTCDVKGATAILLLY